MDKGGILQVSSRNTKTKKNVRDIPVKRTPRSLRIEESGDNQFPGLIPESFNFKNFDIIGKIDDMRTLTKELSIMARQLEQWMGVVHTVSMAFKDNGILKELIKSISAIGSAQNTNPNSNEKPKSQDRTGYLLPPPPFDFFNESSEKEAGHKENPKSTNKNQPQGMNIFEVFNNPAFQEIVSKLFLQKK